MLQLSQRAHIDYEAVFHVLLQQAFEGFVDLLHWDDFDFRNNVVLAAVVEHLLRLRHAANHGTGYRDALADKGEGRNGWRNFRQPDHSER